METDNETDWDIAFRATDIIVNGGTSMGTTDEPTRSGDAGAYIATGTMADVTEVDVNLFTQDSESGYAIISGSGNGWYTYAGPPTYLITPTVGRILVFKTADGKYAKGIPNIQYSHRIFNNILSQYNALIIFNC